MKRRCAFIAKRPVWSRRFSQRPHVMLNDAWNRVWLQTHSVFFFLFLKNQNGTATHIYDRPQSTDNPYQNEATDTYNNLNIEIELRYAIVINLTQNRFGPIRLTHRKPNFGWKRNEWYCALTVTVSVAADRFVKTNTSIQSIILSRFFGVCACKMANRCQ